MQPVTAQAGYLLNQGDTAMAEQDKHPAQSETDSAAAFKDGRKVGPKTSDVQIRPAGPDSQAHKPENWDKVDEAGDESFPASDPPSTY